MIISESSYPAVWGGGDPHGSPIWTIRMERRARRFEGENSALEGKRKTYNSTKLQECCFKWSGSRFLTGYTLGVRGYGAKGWYRSNGGLFPILPSSAPKGPFVDGHILGRANQDERSNG